MNFILLLMPVVIILVFLGGWLLFRRSVENKAKAEALQGFMDLPSGVWQSCLTDQQGPQFLYVPEKRQGKHTTPSKLSVAVKAGVLCDLVIRQINWKDRLGLRLGLARTVVTGEIVFDEKVYVEATNEAFALDLLAKPQVRQAILDLLALGFGSLAWSVGQKTIQSDWVGFQPDGETDVQIVADSASTLEILAFAGAGLEAGGPPDWSARRTLGLAWCNLWMAALSVCIVVGFYRVSQLYQPLAGSWLDGAAWICVALLVFLLPAWFFFRFSPKGHSTLAIWFGVIVVLLAIAEYPVFFTLNGWLDSQASVQAQLPVKNVYWHKNRSITNYYAVLDAPIGGRLVGSVEIDHAIFNQIENKQLNTAEIEYGRGWLGFPWKKSLGFSLRGPKGMDGL